MEEGKNMGDYLKDYLLNVMQQKKHGLYMCEFPTGTGKSYDIVHAMQEYLNTTDDNRKIIYLTTLNKNLPEKALKSAYNNDELYNSDVLRIRSNFDEVVEKIDIVDVPDDMQTETYKQLCHNVLLYRSAKKKNMYKEYVQELTKKITESEKQFRYEIKRKLKKNFPDKIQRKNAVKNNKKYQWIGKLYPAVFTDDHKILLMSISKFMKRNSVIVDSSYEFLNSDLVKDAIIFIDEFDATKDTIQDEIIEKSLQMQEDYVQLFRQICRTLNLKNFSSDMTKAIEQMDKSESSNKFEFLVNELSDISHKYSINLSIKVKEDSVDHKQNFLFNDGAFHTVLQEGKNYVRAALNETDNRVDVFFESKDDFNKHQDKENDLSLYGLLRDINRFLNHFRLFVIKWAKCYMQIVNSTRSSTADEMNEENAISSLLRKLELNDRQRKLLMGETCRIVRNKHDWIFEDGTFYQDGIEYYSFEDDDSHHDNTDLNYVKVFDTPEKIILYLSGIATVFGVSATAEINTVVGNYDINYLKEQLGNDFHSTPEELKEKTKNVLEEKWKPYYDGSINIHGEIMHGDLQGADAEEYCKEFMDSETARYAVNHIKNITDTDYQIKRYCNILKAMCAFNKTENIQSMLYLGMALPKKNNPEMNEETLEKLFELSKMTAGQKPESSLFFLTGDNFDDNKKILEDRLANGEKIFAMSSYQTIGAGQNLQYKIPKDSNVVFLGNFDDKDQRYLYKDFDAIYLANITNMTVNTYQEKKILSYDLLKMFFQIEELYENGEINYSEKDQTIKLAFRSYSGNKQYQYNKLYKTRSVVLQASRMVLQAVGRMCRTYSKNPDIYIFADSELLEKLYVGELEKRILPPEMQKIVSMSSELGKIYPLEENIVLNKAEKISSQGLWKIKQILSKNWTDVSMEVWRILREVCLVYPTANIAEYENNPYIRKFYITSGIKQNQYLYSQYADFSNVVIDFGNDKLAFRNSDRAKNKGDTDEVAVYEMNEKESRLPDILNYPGMREYFENNGYATHFDENEYLMSPVLFHNIYKGALGEVAGKFILEQELGIELQPITEPEYFEFFDYRLSDDVYVDFKNWKFNYVQGRDETIKEILRKMDSIAAKRAYIINIVSDSNYKPSAIADKRVIEIPMLIRKDRTVCYDCLNMILREDFENEDK